MTVILISLGAKSKGSNGGVAVGLPHRNSSVFKQTPVNQCEIKIVEARRRASEAKGPFPGGKRVGSWGKKKGKRKKKVDPPSAVLTLTHKYFGVAEKT